MTMDYGAYELTIKGQRGNANILIPLTIQGHAQIEYICTNIKKNLTLVLSKGLDFSYEMKINMVSRNTSLDIMENALVIDMG